MSIPERIYKISRAYLGQVRDRIDAELAERELEASLRGAEGPERDDASPDAMMRRAEQRIAAMRREIDERNGGGAASPGGGTATATAATASGVATQEDADPNARDFRMMGVPVGSDFSTVQAAYEKLARRCDPRRFPDGSSEQKEAERILARVNAAYEALRKRLDPIQSRFGKIEYDDQK